MSKHIAAIDIGSNGIRLIIAEKTEIGLKAIVRLREPIRLGRDVFSRGTISQVTLDRTVRALRTFKKTTDNHQVESVEAVATSAVREAKNSKQFCETVLAKTGLKVKTISGKAEADLIFDAVSREIDLTGRSAVLIDIGGGSVEVSIAFNQLLSHRKSFAIGTVRILEELNRKGWSEKQINLLLAEHLQSLFKHLHSETIQPPFHFAIGTGGNLETLGKLKLKILSTGPSSSLSLAEIDQVLSTIQKLNYNERGVILGLKEDRVDVIVPAIMTVKMIMIQAQVDKILIPNVGLRDGLLWSQFAKHQST